MPFILCRGPPGNFKTHRTLGTNKCRDRAVMEHVPKQRTTRSTKMINGDQKPPTPLTILKHATRKHDRRMHVTPTAILTAFSCTSRRRKPESFDCSPNSSNINSEAYTPNLPAKMQDPKQCSNLNRCGCRLSPSPRSPHGRRGAAPQKPRQRRECPPRRSLAQGCGDHRKCKNQSHTKGNASCLNVYDFENRINNQVKTA